MKCLRADTASGESVCDVFALARASEERQPQRELSYCQSGPAVHQTRNAFRPDAVLQIPDSRFRTVADDEVGDVLRFVLVLNDLAPVPDLLTRQCTIKSVIVATHFVE